jgi:hypothetical protein
VSISKHSNVFPVNGLTYAESFLVDMIIRLTPLEGPLNKIVSELIEVPDVTKV